VEEFAPAELVYVLKMLGVTPSAYHEENAKILRSVINPDRLDDVVHVLSGFRTNPNETIYETRRSYSPTYLTAAERVGLPRPSHLPPIEPQIPNFLSPLWQQSPSWQQSPTGEWVKTNFYSPNKVFLGGIYEDDDYDDDDYDYEDDDYDTYSGLPPALDTLSNLFASPAPAQGLFPTPSPTQVAQQQSQLAQLFRK
jgi:hypothetical protein